MKSDFQMYDVYCGYDGIIQVMAISEADALNIARIKGYNAIVAAVSIF